MDKVTTKPDEKTCDFCGKRGGRLMLSPYEQDVQDRQVTVRLHKACADAEAQEI